MMLERDPERPKKDSDTSDTFSHISVIRHILDDRIAAAQWQAGREAYNEAFGKGDLEETVKKGEELAALARQSFDPGDSRIGISDLLAGRALVQAGRSAEAEPKLESAIGNLCESLGDGAHEVAIARSELASAFGARGMWKEAELEIKRSLGILEIHAGISSAAKQDLARVTSQYAACFEELGKDREAKFYHAKAINRLEEAFGPISEEVATAYANAAGIAMKQGNYSSAVPDLTHAIHVMDALYGPGDSRSAPACVHLSAAYRHLRQPDKARDYARRAVDSLPEGSTSPVLVDALNNLALATYSSGQPAEAMPIFRSVLEKEISRLGKDHPALGATHYNLGSCQAECREHADAEKSFLESLRLMKQVRDENDGDLMAIKKSLASVYIELGRPFRAEGILRQVFEQCEKCYAPDSPQTLTTLRQLISVSISNSNITEAERLNDLLGERLSGAGGPLRILYADVLDNAAGIALIRKDYDEAERLFTRELELQKEILGPDAQQLAPTFQNLAQTYIAAGELDKAADVLAESLTIFETHYGSRSHHVANCLHLMGRVAHEEKDYDRAEEYYGRALATHEEISGDRLGPVVVPVLNDYATMLRDLGSLYAGEDEFARSLELLERARDVLLSFGRDEHPTMVSVLGNMAAVLEDLERDDEAEALRREAESIRIAIGFRNDTELQ